MQILKRTDGWCESGNQAWDSIPECPMMNRDGYRPIQRVNELAIYNMGGNEGILSSFWDEGFLYLGVT